MAGEFIILIFSLFLLLPAVLTSLPADVKTWCGKTPHPEPCNYFMSQKYLSLGLVMQKHDFLKATIRLALEQAIQARANAYAIGSNCRNDRERAAWLACLELYDHTVFKLNETADPTIKSSWADDQTWLSAALTNLETCKTGFVELGVYHGYISSMISNNVSFLISNSLAVNNDIKYEVRSGFSSWISPRDRRLLQQTLGPRFQAHCVVAQDGSGNYKTVTEALVTASKRHGNARYVIYVKSGIYSENIKIGAKLKNIMLVGDGKGKTIITGSKSFEEGIPTFLSATCTAVGDGFIARGITFRNTAGPKNHQAVAFRSSSDSSVFYQCSFEGYQDTLYVHSQRQFYRECDIYGTVDFIFGNAAVVLQYCNIFARFPPKQINTITAQSRANPHQNTGISIHKCRVTAAPDLKPVQGSVKTYLGRPWKEYSRTVFIKTFLDSLVHPDGWMPWSGDFGLNSLYYGEYLNTGPGTLTAGRVKWGGYHVITSATEASNFTVESLITGKTWLPATRVPFIPGL